MLRGGVKELRVVIKLESLKRKLEKVDALMGQLVLSTHPDTTVVLEENLPRIRALRDRANELIYKATVELHNVK